jgi:hypothetical protein
MEQREGPAVAAAAAPPGASTDDADEADTPPATPRIAGESLTPRPAQRSISSLSGAPPHKKQKATPTKTPRPGNKDLPEEPVTPKIISSRESSDQIDPTLAYRWSNYDESNKWSEEDMKLPKTPVPTVARQRSVSSSSPSDLSFSSRRDGSMSPVTPYISEVPPAPPSTPASDFKSTLSASRLEGMSTPLPYATAVRNAAQLERQQMLSDGAVTPAPTKQASNRTAPETSRSNQLVDDFTDWVVGDRYKLVRMLGRGSYGEVAQAFDLQNGNTSVAIKRIQSPFDQEVDAVRLFREIHILRRLKGHDCVIDLLDVVQPPTNELDDFLDLYLVFECKCFLSMNL